MASAWIVEAGDVLKEGGVDLPSGVPGVAPYEFGLHRLEKRFDYGVVITISLATHRDFNALRSIVVGMLYFNCSKACFF